MPADFETMRRLYREQLCELPTCSMWSMKPGRLDAGYVLADAFTEHGYRTTARELSSFVAAARAAQELKDRWFQTPPEFRTSFYETTPTDREAWRRWQRLRERIPLALLEIRLGGLALPLATILTGRFLGRRRPGGGGFNVKVYNLDGRGPPVGTGYFPVTTAKGATFAAMKRFGVRTLRSP